MLLCHLCLPSSSSPPPPPPPAKESLGIQILWSRQWRVCHVSRDQALSWMLWSHYARKEKEENGNHEDCSGLEWWMAWPRKWSGRRMLRQTVNWPGIDLILCTLLIWPCHGEIEKPKWMWGQCSLTWAHYTDKPTMNLKVGWNGAQNRTGVEHHKTQGKTAVSGPLTSR